MTFQVGDEVKLTPERLSAMPPTTKELFEGKVLTVIRKDSFATPDNYVHVSIGGSMLHRYYFKEGNLMYANSLTDNLIWE